MTKANRDPLLATMRIILTFLLGLSVVIGVACLIAAPVLPLLDPAQVHILTEHGPAPDHARYLVTVALLLGAIFAGMCFMFLRGLRRIVDSVGQGDPFVPANAQRLTQMAWIAILLEIPAIALTSLGAIIDRTSGEGSIEIDVPLTGLIIGLLLFVLARVFREGARMREELEGTV